MYGGRRFFQDYTTIPLDKSRIEPITNSFLETLQTNSHITNSISSILLNIREIVIVPNLDNLFKKRKELIKNIFILFDR